MPTLHDPAEVARVVRLKDFGSDLLLREVQQRVLEVLRMAGRCPQISCGGSEPAVQRAKRFE